MSKILKVKVGVGSGIGRRVEERRVKIGITIG